ncbi:MAG: BMP family ABC transporter substrate-binding protein [Actinobacteria bacterium]|nr:BMP family ABC transporter substrate-binding protein [Actinomycetota bacterium]
MRRAMGGALLAVVVLLAACRSGAPTPAPSPSPTVPTASPAPVSGLAVAVVLPPASTGVPAEAVAMRAELEQLRRRHGDDVGSLRVVQPDTPAFVEDVTELLADRGADLVCVLGPASGAAVRAVAPRFPETEFCATPALSEPGDLPPNVLQIDVRVEEVAYLAGVAAYVADPARPAGFIAGESEYGTDRQRAAFVAGINAVASEPVTPYVGFPAGDEERGYELAAPQYAAGVRVIFTAAGEGDVGVHRAAEEAAGTRALVVGSQRTLAPGTVTGAEDAPPAAVLMTTVLHVAVPVGLALEQVLGTWEGGQASVGLQEGALGVAPGGSPRYRAVAAAVDEARRRIEAGEFTPLPAD